MGSTGRLTSKKFLEMGGADIIGAGTDTAGVSREMMKMIGMISAWILVGPHATKCWVNSDLSHLSYPRLNASPMGMYMEWIPGSWEELLTDPRDSKGAK